MRLTGGLWKVSRTRSGSTWPGLTSAAERREQPAARRTGHMRRVSAAAAGARLCAARRRGRGVSVGASLWH